MEYAGKASWSGKGAKTGIPAQQRPENPAEQPGKRGRWAEGNLAGGKPSKGESRGKAREEEAHTSEGRPDRIPRLERDPNYGGRHFRDNLHAETFHEACIAFKLDFYKMHEFSNQELDFVESTAEILRRSRMTRMPERPEEEPERPKIAGVYHEETGLWRVLDPEDPEFAETMKRVVTHDIPWIRGNWTDDAIEKTTPHEQRCPAADRAAPSGAGGKTLWISFVIWTGSIRSENCLHDPGNTWTAGQEHLCRHVRQTAEGHEHQGRT
jgi:hypothetical protein